MALAAAGACRSWRRALELPAAAGAGWAKELPELAALQARERPAGGRALIAPAFGEPPPRFGRGCSVRGGGGVEELPEVAPGAGVGSARWALIPPGSRR